MCTAWYQRATEAADRLILAKGFDDIFVQRSGYKDLDQLLIRLHRRKDELLIVLERPKIPLYTNASENELRACVTKRRISGGTMSADGREARDVMLGLKKTSKARHLLLRLSGDRLGLYGPAERIPFLPELVVVRPA